MSQQAAPARIKILLIEPDEQEAAMVGLWLRTDAGAEVVHVMDTKAGLRRMKTDVWDLVIADLSGQNADSLDFIADAKDRSGRAPILVLTADSSPAFVTRMVKQRADGVVFRPLGRKELVQQAVHLAHEAHRTRERADSQRKRVLAIGAHPDDVEIGIGGILSKHRAAGDEVMILTLTRGTVGGDADVRTSEGKNAANLLGASLTFGNLIDTTITENGETIELIKAAVAAFNPTHVYTHTYQDAHQDHRAVYRATVVAARDIPDLYCYQSPTSTVDFRPHLYVDVSDFMTKKLALIGAHASQVGRRPNLDSDLIAATARYWGRYANYVLAEPLEIVRSTR